MDWFCVYGGKCLQLIDKTGFSTQYFNCRTELIEAYCLVIMLIDCLNECVKECVSSIFFIFSLFFISKFFYIGSGKNNTDFTDSHINF